MMAMLWILLLCLTLACDGVDKTYGSLDTGEQDLLMELFTNYSTDARPASNSQTPVVVFVKMLIVRLDTVSEKGQSMRTKLHVRYEWYNPGMNWIPEDYNNITEVIIKKSKIWTPPIILLNEASRITYGEILEQKYEDTVLLTHKGNCSLSFSQFFNSTCEVDVSQFPFDKQICEMKFGSWSMDSTLLLLQNVNDNATDPSYPENGEWKLKKSIMKNNMNRYSIQKKNHSIIVMTLEIERKSFFFINNLVVPCALIACMIFLVFVLPPKSGERISLGITVMLSMAIFQELSSKNLPSSSDNYPLLGVYYSTSMFEIGIALIMNCFIMNLYYRNYAMPGWVRRLVLGKLAKLMLVPVPEARRCENFDNVEYQKEVDALADSTLYNDNHIDTDNGVGDENSEIYQSRKVSRQEMDTARNQRLSTVSTFLHRNHTLSEIREEGEPRRMSMQSSSFPLFEEQQREEKKALGEDWRIAARVIDRLMLLLSITVGFVSALSIFSTAERFRNMFKI